jgi:hydroxymethylbilane synthase
LDRVLKSGSVGRVKEVVVVGARGSRLAQIMVQELIAHLSGCPVVRFRARSVMTDGDRDRKTLLRSLGGGEGGVFTTQLEEELLAGRVDIAVHSLKDLPTAPREGTVLAVTPPRADPLDALCGSTVRGLRPGARVGTGSARRMAQLKALRPDVEVVPIRGNVPGRLARAGSGLDAVVLAASGLRRLGQGDAITELLDPAVFPPSPGQGALAAVPVGGLAVRLDRVIALTGQVTSLDGRDKVCGAVTGTDPEATGAALAALLRRLGSDAILDEIRAGAAR